MTLDSSLAVSFENENACTFSQCDVYKWGGGGWFLTTRLGGPKE